MANAQPASAGRKIAATLACHVRRTPGGATVALAWRSRCCARTLDARLDLQGARLRLTARSDTFSVSMPLGAALAALAADVAAGASAERLARALEAHTRAHAHCRPRVMLRYVTSPVPHGWPRLDPDEVVPVVEEVGGARRYFSCNVRGFLCALDVRRSAVTLGAPLRCCADARMEIRWRPAGDTVRALGVRVYTRRCTLAHALAVRVRERALARVLVQLAFILGTYAPGERAPPHVYASLGRVVRQVAVTTQGLLHCRAWPAP